MNLTAVTPKFNTTNQMNQRNQRNNVGPAFGLNLVIEKSLLNSLPDQTIRELNALKPKKIMGSKDTQVDPEVVIAKRNQIVLQVLKCGEFEGPPIIRALTEKPEEIVKKLKQLLTKLQTEYTKFESHKNAITAHNNIYGQ